MSRQERILRPERSAREKFGYELRKWRKASGLSQDRLGVLLHVSGDLLHRIEIGERRPQRELVVNCDKVLRASGELIAAWEDCVGSVKQDQEATDNTDNAVVGNDTQPNGLALSPMDSSMIVVSVASLTGEVIPVAVDRRAFVAGAVSLPIVGLLGREIPDLSIDTLDGNVQDITMGMAALKNLLVQQDNILGPGAAAPTVIQQLSILEKLIRNVRGKVRESVRRIQADYSEFAGWLSDELGDRRAGQYWTDRALEWAHEIDDELTVGYVLARKSQRAVEEGDPASAISLSQAAQRRGALTSRVRAAALQFEALGHAASGEVNDFRAAIERASELVVSSNLATDDHRAVWCTQEYVAMQEAAGWVKLGQYVRGVTTYEQGLMNWPSGFRRDMGLYYGRLACAYAKAGNPEEAANAGNQALDIARGTGSVRIVAELESLQATLLAWRRLPLVQSFNSNLNHVIAEKSHQSKRQAAIPAQP